MSTINAYTKAGADAKFLAKVEGAATYLAKSDALVLYSLSRQEIFLPAPTGVAATDDAAISAAITAATGAFARSGGVIVSRPGEYSVSSLHNIPDGVDLIGCGGGSTSRRGRTIFTCTTAAAGISISGGGGKSGGFEINGATTANTPFMRLGGTGANARSFENITVHDNTGATSDLALFYGAQNDIWTQCGFAGASRDLGVFDQGYGGGKFYRCEWRTAGRYHHRYDNQVGGGVYAQPTDIKHDGGILEGNAGTSLVIFSAAANVTYGDHAFYCATAPTGPMIDVVAGYGLSLHNPWIQCTNATVAGTIGIKARGAAGITVSGRANMQNLDVAASVDGTTSFIYAQCNWQFANVTTNFGATGGGSTAQIAAFQIGTRFTLGASGDFAEISQPTSRDRFLFSRTVGGVLSWYNNVAGTFVPDVQLLRRAPGAVGVPNGTQQLIATGAGTTAQRPAASGPLAGSTYFNTDANLGDGLLQACTGAKWVDPITHTWTAATILAGITSNPNAAGNAPVGYTKVAGVVHLRGTAGSVSVGNTVLFQLPAGYRPEFPKNIPIMTMNGSAVVTVGYISIATNGNVTVPAGAGALVSFDGVCFPAEA